MSERDIDPGLRSSQGERPHGRAPRFLLSRHRAALIVVLGYAGLVVCAWLFLSYVESTQGYHDNRVVFATLFFAALMLALCVRALINIYKSVNLPSPW